MTRAQVPGSRHLFWPLPFLRRHVTGCCYDFQKRIALRLLLCRRISIEKLSHSERHHHHRLTQIRDHKMSADLGPRTRFERFSCICALLVAIVYRFSSIFFQTRLSAIQWKDLLAKRIK